MTAFDEIENLIRPPESPLYGGTFSGVSVCDIYVARLPSDFSWFIGVYGSGVIDNFLWILNPLSGNENISFSVSGYLVKAYSEMKKEFPERYPRPEFPDRGSFLPWAITDNGDSIVWIVEGPPDAWHVAIHGDSQEEEEVYKLGFIEFMVKFLSGKIESSIIPKSFLYSGAHKFFRAEVPR